MLSSSLTSIGQERGEKETYATIYLDTRISFQPMHKKMVAEMGTKDDTCILYASI